MSEHQQINTLLYCMSQDAEDILQTTWISWAERDKYDSVIERLDKHFGVMKNVVYEWARFNTRRQQHRETGHHYILAFYMLAVNCNYGATQEQEICDYLIISIRDVKLSQKPQMDRKLTLENGKKKIWQDEVREQNQELSSAGVAGESHDNPIEIGFVTRKHHCAPRRQQLSQHGRWNLVHHSREVALCTQCGWQSCWMPCETPPATSVEKMDTLALNAFPSRRNCRSWSKEHQFRLVADFLQTLTLLTFYGHSLWDLWTDSLGCTSVHGQADSGLQGRHRCRSNCYISLTGNYVMLTCPKWIRCCMDLIIPS